LPYEKKTYFFSELESTLVESMLVLSVVGGGGGATSVFVVSEAGVSSGLPESLQATKAAIAKTNNSFFIVPFFVLTNDFKVNTETGKK
jgi:hypothetical protein